MSCIVKQKRKGTDIVYAYQSESIWVPGVGPRSKRKLIGRVDPISGEIVPTGNRGRKKKEPMPPDTRNDATTAPAVNGCESAKQELIDAVSRIHQLEDSLAEMKKENQMLRTDLQNVQTRMRQTEQYLKNAKSLILNSLDTCISTCQ